MGLMHRARDRHAGCCGIESVEAVAHVIVADDESLFRWAVVQRLVREGHAVTEAEDGAAALWAAEAVPAPDVMLLDLKLPDMSGLRVLRVLRQRHPGMAVVIMTAYWAAEALEDARRLGVHHLLAKPLDLDRVAAVVATARGDWPMLTLTRVLCPTDFSDISVKAEAYATALARYYDARLTFLHVAAPTMTTAPYDGIPIDVHLFDEQQRQAARGLAAAQERARAQGVDADVSLRSGDPAREALTMADAQSADIVVLGTQGRSGVAHLVLGSVAEQVMRKASCPVMVVPSGARGGTEGLFSRILCPIDGSESSGDAVKHAVSLARETDGRLILLHVIEPGPPRDAFSTVYGAEYQRMNEVQAQTLVHEALAPDVREWCHCEEVLAHGAASARILETAAARDADVIVMGVRGRGALDLMAFGSTTNTVIRQATCPVLAVHPRAARVAQPGAEGGHVPGEAAR